MKIRRHLTNYMLEAHRAGLEQWLRTIAGEETDFVLLVCPRTGGHSTAYLANCSYEKLSSITAEMAFHFNAEQLKTLASAAETRVADFEQPMAPAVQS